MVRGDLVALGRAGLAEVPGCPNATAGTAQIRSSSGSSGATTRTVTLGGRGGACGGVVSTISGCVWTSRPAPAAAAAISGAVCSIHSKDSGMISSRCRARMARTSATVMRDRAPRLGRA